MLAGMVARLDGELLSRQWSADLALTGLIFNAVFAQGPRPPRPLAKEAPRLQGEMKELGRIADKIDAWKLASIDGADFFNKDQDEIRIKLQLTTKIKLSNFSLEAKPIAPNVSTSSVSPSPIKHQTFLSCCGIKPLFSKYFINLA